MGLAGYDPAEEDMRGIFMAKGPGEERYSEDKLCSARHLLDGSTLNKLQQTLPYSHN